jgi:hypothetical protein
MMIKKLLLLLPLFLGLQNCGKKVTVKDSNSKSSDTFISPPTNPKVKISSVWTPVTLTSSSMNLVVGKSFKAEVTQGEYVASDFFEFSGASILRITENGGAGDRLYSGSVIFGTDGSFQLRDGSARGRVFLLRNAYQNGSKTMLYFEYYNSGTNTESGPFDGYLTMISQ